MKNRLPIFILLIMLMPAIFLSNCKSRNQSALRDVAFDRDAKNGFIMFSAPTSQGADDLTSAIAPNFKAWKEAFADLLSSQNFAFEDYQDATRATIVGRTIEFAKTLGPSSTLVWYFNGHGESGEVISSDSQRLSIAELLSDMKKAGVDIHRMMIIASACYSGKIAMRTVSGFQLNDAPVSSQPMTNDFPHSPLPQHIDAGALPTKELFTLTAARTFERGLIDTDTDKGRYLNGLIA